MHIALIYDKSMAVMSIFQHIFELTDHLGGRRVDSTCYQDQTEGNFSISFHRVQPVFSLRNTLLDRCEHSTYSFSDFGPLWIHHFSSSLLINLHMRLDHFYIKCNNIGYSFAWRILELLSQLNKSNWNAHVCFLCLLEMRIYFNIATSATWIGVSTIAAASINNIEAQFAHRVQCEQR